MVLLSGTKKSIKGDSGRRLTARLRVTRRLPSGTHGRGRHCMIEGGGLARWRQWSAKLRDSLRYKSPVRGALVDVTRRSRSDHPYNNKQSYPLLWWCINCRINSALFENHLLRFSQNSKLKVSWKYLWSKRHCAMSLKRPSHYYISLHILHSLSLASWIK